MTGIRDVLVHVNDETVSRQAVELAAALAGPLDARLTLLVAVPPVGTGVGLSAETAALARQVEQAQRASLRQLGERLAAVAQPRLAAAVELRIADGDPVDVLLPQARTTDLVVVSQRDPAGDGGLGAGQAARLLVGAPCPVLTVPHIGWAGDRAASPAQPVLQRALVAWSDTRESARAVRDAMPLLARASSVEVVSFGGGAQDRSEARRSSLQAVAAYLGQHGVVATTSVLSQREPSLGERMQRGWMPDVAVAEALLSHAADAHADFIVMGGYGHSRVWELVLGGVTRTMLATMTVPVLMSH